MSRNIDRWVRQMHDAVAWLEVPTDVEQRFQKYENDPVSFANNVLGITPSTALSNVVPARRGAF